MLLASTGIPATGIIAAELVDFQWKKCSVDWMKINWKITMKYISEEEKKDMKIFNSQLLETFSMRHCASKSVQPLYLEFKRNTKSFNDFYPAWNSMGKIWKRSDVRGPIALKLGSDRFTQKRIAETQSEANCQNEKWGDLYTKLPKIEK